MLKQDTNLLSRIDNSMEFINNMGKVACAVCNNLMVDPVKTHPAGVNACKQCVMNMQLCPLTKKPLQICECDPDVKEKLGLIKIRCKNKVNGCNENLKIYELVHHEAECYYRKLHCSNFQCGGEFIAGDLPNHMQNCQFTLKNCCHCRRPILFKDLAVHENSCSERLKECPGCKLNFKIQLFSEHERNCDKIQIKCIKCDKFMPKEEFAIHDETTCFESMISDFQTNAANHIDSLQNSISFLRRKRKEKENLLYIKCHRCGGNQCELLTRFCDVCNRSFCTRCFKQPGCFCESCCSFRCSKCLRQANKDGGCQICLLKQGKSSIIPEPGSTISAFKKQLA